MNEDLYLFGKSLELEKDLKRWPAICFLADNFFYSFPDEFQTARTPNTRRPKIGTRKYWHLVFFCTRQFKCLSNLICFGFSCRKLVWCVCKHPRWWRGALQDNEGMPNSWESPISSFHRKFSIRWWFRLSSAKASQIVLKNRWLLVDECRSLGIYIIIYHKKCTRIEKRHMLSSSFPFHLS